MQAFTTLRRFLATLALAFALTQSGQAALASGTGNAPMLDAFGNPLCISGMVAPAQPGHGGGRAAPDCCLTGCQTGGAVFIAPDSALLAGHHPAERAAPLSPRSHPPVFPIARAATARAPPAAA